MDCCVCNPIPMILRPPRNSICLACYECAKSLIAFLNNLENDTAPKERFCSPNSSASQLNSSTKGIESALKWMKEFKQREEGLNEKIKFLGGLVDAFREGIHSDIQVKPGNFGPSIPAHRALLAIRSNIFKNMLESDRCKAAPTETITFSELNHEELDSLLEFLYSGNLATEKVEKHVYTLSIAADKYEISYLQKFCERQMLKSLDSSNALEVLEISDVCSNKTLREAAMKSIVNHMEDIVFSTKYDDFARKNPHLGVQITRALFIDKLTKT